jgi:hypothetical protein
MQLNSNALAYNRAALLRLSRSVTTLATSFPLRLILIVI